MIKRTYIYAKSVKDIDGSIWSQRWPNFSASEVACKGSGEVWIECEAMDKLQKMREIVGVALFITSAYRTPEHNKKVGGSPNSQHVQGRAFDIKTRAKWGAAELEAVAKAVGFTGIGLYDTFIHVDNRPTGQARWDFRGRKGDGIS